MTCLNQHKEEINCNYYCKFKKIHDHFIFANSVLDIFVTFSCICNFGIFVLIFLKFSPKCRTKKLSMIHTILGSFCSFLNCEGADILPQIRPRKGISLYYLKAGFFFLLHLVELFLIIKTDPFTYR